MYGTESDGFALQRRLSALCNDWLIPALEHVLDRLAPPDLHLYIEHLDLDAGILSLDRLEHDLTENVAMAIEKAIKEQMVPGEAAGVINKVPSWHSPVKSEIQSVLAAFLYFLDTGRLPWSFRLPVGASLESVVFAQHFSPDQLILLKKRLSSSSVQQRLINQFSLPFLEHFLNQLSPEGRALFKQIASKVRLGDLSISQVNQVEKKLMALIFKQVANQSLPPENELVIALIQSLPAPEWMAPLKQQWPDLEPKTSAQKAKNSGDKINNKQSESRRVQSDSSSDNDLYSRPKDNQGIDNDNAELRPLHPFLSTSENNKDLRLEEIEGIYIDNAGLVLLHPFLPMFFEALGIVQQENLLDPNWALTMLHFLTTGQTKAPEYELVLPKILCNLPLETPVETDRAITDTEKEESEALLTAVIRHWNVLGDSSPDALRGTFLCRAGKISRRDDNDWLLQVEYQSFDVLLDQLPWGISMIKLPWMKSMIWVEWV